MSMLPNFVVVLVKRKKRENIKKSNEGKGRRKKGSYVNSMVLANLGYHFTSALVFWGKKKETEKKGKEKAL